MYLDYTYNLCLCILLNYLIIICHMQNFFTSFIKYFTIFIVYGESIEIDIYD